MEYRIEKWEAMDVLPALDPQHPKDVLLLIGNALGWSTLPQLADTALQAGAALSPAVIANYAYDLAKEFNQYYHETPILREEDQGLLKFRLELISVMARTLRSAMGILGIELPERM